MIKQIAKTSLKDLDYLEGMIRVIGDDDSATVFLVDKNGTYHLLKVIDSHT
jgi:hypothetical protein